MHSAVNCSDLTAKKTGTANPKLDIAAFITFKALHFLAQILVQIPLLVSSSRLLFLSYGFSGIHCTATLLQSEVTMPSSWQTYLSYISSIPAQSPLPSLLVLSYRQTDGLADQPLILSMRIGFSVHFNPERGTCARFSVPSGNFIGLRPESLFLLSQLLAWSVCSLANYTLGGRILMSHPHSLHDCPRV